MLCAGGIKSHAFAIPCAWKVSRTLDGIVHPHACDHVPPSCSGARHSGRRIRGPGLRKLCVHHDQRYGSGDNTVHGGRYELVLVVRRGRRNRYGVDRRCARVSVECRESVPMGVDYIGGARTRRRHTDLYRGRERRSSGEARCPRRERSSTRCHAGCSTVPFRSRSVIQRCRARGWGAHHPGPHPSGVRVEHSKRRVMGKSHPRRGTRRRVNPGLRRAEHRVRTSDHCTGCG